MSKLKIELRATNMKSALKFENTQEATQQKDKGDLNENKIICIFSNID